MKSKKVNRSRQGHSTAGISAVTLLLAVLSAIFSLYGVLATFRNTGLPTRLYDAIGQSWSIVRDSPVVFVSGQEVSPHWMVAAGGLLAKIFPCCARWRSLGPFSRWSQRVVVEVSSKISLGLYRLGRARREPCADRVGKQKG